jgi:chemotaxis protein methyltransferase CheR
LTATAGFRESELEHPLAPREFEEVRKLAYGSFGLELKPGKEELVSARLGNLVRKGNFRSFGDYCAWVRSDASGRSLAAMIDALATNHTAFLREPDHFQFLRERVLPELAARRTLELWSAACSTGEEVWTLACLINESFPARDVRILASDVSGKALRTAQNARYPAERCQDLPSAWLARFFAAQGRPVQAYQVRPEICRQAAFRRLNLIETISGVGPLPVIFCRNVMIYFDRATQEKVVRQLTGCLEPGGYLFVGHAESLTRVPHCLEYIRPAVYRKPVKREGKWTKSW